MPPRFACAVRTSARPATGILVSGGLILGLLSGCGGGAAKPAAAPAPKTSSASPAAAPTTSSAPAPPSTAATTAATGTAAAAPAAGATFSGTSGGAGTRAVAILPTKATVIGPKALKNGARYAAIPALNLGLLGTIPGGKAFPVGKTGPQGLIDSGSWPDACTMLSDADIKTLLPKSGKPRRQGQHGAFLGGGETKHFASCKVEIPEPGDGGVPSYVQIGLSGVGDPEAINSSWQRSFTSQLASSAKYPEQFLDYSGGQVGGAKCFYDGSALQCIKGHFDFDVYGSYFKSDIPPGDAFFAVKKGYLQQVIANICKTLALRMS